MRFDSSSLAGGCADLAVVAVETERRPATRNNNWAVLRKIRRVQGAICGLTLLMKTQDVMTKDVHTCLPDTNLGLAALQMSEGDFGVLPVVEDHGRVAGMITDRDICMGVASRDQRPSEIPVEEVMSHEVYSCSPQDEIRDALRTMQQRRVRRLPVIEKGKIVGLLSLNDLALKARSSDQAELSAQDVEETLKEISAHSTSALGRPFQRFAAPAADISA